jgi:hypothetical protein
MLRYDTVKDNIWHGYLMIVSTDAGSTYDPIAPNALLEWDATASGFEHHKAGSPEEESDASVNRRHINGIRIFTYHSLAGPQSFWRFKLEVPLGEREEEIFYSINVSSDLVPFLELLLTCYLFREDLRTLSGSLLSDRTCAVSDLRSSSALSTIADSFRHSPGVGHSCNGFSGGVNTAAFNG